MVNQPSQVDIQPSIDGPEITKRWKVKDIRSLAGIGKGELFFVSVGRRTAFARTVVSLYKAGMIDGPVSSACLVPDPQLFQAQWFLWVNRQLQVASLHQLAKECDGAAFLIEHIPKLRYRQAECRQAFPQTWRRFHSDFRLNTFICFVLFCKTCLIWICDMDNNRSQL